MAGKLERILKDIRRLFTFSDGGEYKGAVASLSSTTKQGDNMPDQTPYFIVVAKAAVDETTVFSDIEAATAAADTQAKASVGNVVTVYEARREALAPAPDVTNSDITVI